MTLGASRATERSIESLQTIYAVVISLAIGQAIQALIKAPSEENLMPLDQVSKGLPVFVAFVFTLVPFYHGMNRHLDRAYLEKTDRVVRWALLMDFGIFFIEAGLLFAVAWSLRSGLRGFILLGSLLGVDMLWGAVSHVIHARSKESTFLKWCAINSLAIAVATVALLLPIQSRPFFLMALAIVRTVVDYACCWRFYFPRPAA